MMIALVQTQFSIEEWQRRLEVQDMEVWYDCDIHQEPGKHTNLDFERGDMTNEAEEQLYNHQQEAWEEIFSANKTIPRTMPRTYEYDEVPGRKKPI